MSKNKKNGTDKKKGICKSTLMKREGWTEGAIKKFAPKCQKRINPWGPSLPPMLVYELEDVERIETTPEFAKHLEKHLKLSEACKKYRAQETPAQKKKRKDAFITQDKAKTVLAVEFAKIAPIQVIHIDNVVQVALKANADWRESMGWKREQNPNTRSFYWQHRIVLYHIINELTNFPILQQELANMRKMQDANPILRTRVCAAIDKTYPELGLLKSVGFVNVLQEFGCELIRRGSK